MKKFAFIILMCALSHSLLAQHVAGIIPKPVSIIADAGQFTIHNGLRINGPKNFSNELYFLQKELLRYQRITTIIAANQPHAQIVLKQAQPADDMLYQLNIKPHKITIEAANHEGAFYGIISLLQLINNNDEGIIPCMKIADQPAYAWRGIMLDESRHFFGKEKVKSLLDWMAYYKLNRFHWHLTDEPGWRIEILKYPKLGEIGGIGNFTNKEAPCHYYTQNDIKEIVAYASERHIEIIPEIDMPGHATAANRAYPEYSGGGSEKHPEFTFHPAKEETYQYLADILHEVDVLFPSQMIHIGGDEVSFGNHQWNTDEAIQKMMKTHDLDNLKAVEDMFMRRMSDSLLNMNNQVLVWDEMADAALPQDSSIIFWWRHDKKEQLALSLKNGHKTVICPRLPLYFDFVQHPDHKVGRRWGGGFNQLENIYNFSLSQLPVNTSVEHLILGFQANLWTETVDSFERFDFLLFPRIAALSEAVWSANNNDYAEFLNRLQPHLSNYKKAGLYYFNPFEASEHPEPTRQKK